MRRLRVYVREYARKREREKEKEKGRRGREGSKKRKKNRRGGGEELNTRKDPPIHIGGLRQFINGRYDPEAINNNYGS